MVSSISGLALQSQHSRFFTPGWVSAWDFRLMRLLRLRPAKARSTGPKQG